MELDELFSRIVEEMPGYLAAAVGSFDSERDFYSHTTGDIDLSYMRNTIPKMVQNYADIYNGLGGAIDLGSNDEILITASRVYLLIKLNHERHQFVAVLLSSSGNIGYLRFRIRDYLRFVSES
jgi:predicted regulator of Ras-like GTPase activity (Roadblock/LC7/MglB family)